MTNLTNRFHTIRALLVDDDEDDFLLTKKTLTQTRTIEASIEWSSHFDEALQYCKSGQFDVILLDYKMGNHDGIEFIQKAKNLCKAPFILLTGIQDEKLGIKAIRLGAEDYLVKSEITPELLERSILYAIERFQSKTKEQELIERKTLERSERHYRSLIENSADGIALMNEKFRLTYVAPSIKKILGYTPEQLLTGSTKSIIYPEDIQKIHGKFKDVVRNPGTYITILLRAKHNNGSWRWIEITASNMLLDPNIEAYVLNFRDVTTRVKLDQLKDDFLSIASHELKTPLTTIKGYIQLLEKYLQKSNDEKALKYIRQSDTYVDKMNQMISDLLDISRIQSGRMQLNLEETQICSLIKRTITALQHLSSKHVLNFDCNAHPVLFADKHRIEQVLTNLISNAIKYSPNKSKIAIRLKADTRFAQISVQDQGIGISPSSQERLFQRFYRVDKTANRFSGLGIGLYISNEIIKKHNGKMWVESDEGKGSTFYFTLPLKI